MMERSSSHEIKSTWKEHIKNYEVPTVFKEELLKPYFSDLTLPGPLLDIGSGTGYFAEMFAAKGLAVTGIDQSPAVKRAGRLAKYVKGEGSQLPFKSGDFNSVLIINVLSAIDDEAERVKVLAEAKRVKSREASIYVVNSSEKMFAKQTTSDVLRFNRISDSRAHLRLKKVDGSYIEFDDHILSGQDMANYAKRAGLKIRETKDFVYQPEELEVYSLFVLE